jgi:hypothetical protein
MKKKKRMATARRLIFLEFLKASIAYLSITAKVGSFLAAAEVLLKCYD